MACVGARGVRHVYINTINIVAGALIKEKADLAFSGIRLTPASHLLRDIKHQPSTENLPTE